MGGAYIRRHGPTGKDRAVENNKHEHNGVPHV